MGDIVAGGSDPTVEQGHDVDILSPGVGDGGGETAGDRNLCRMSSKNCCVIYCDNANYGPVSGGRMASRGVGFKAVVGAE